MSEDRSETPRRSVRERADKLLDRVAWGAVSIPSMALTGFLRLLAYGREGAKDVWTEAESVRRRKKRLLKLTGAQGQAKQNSPR
jgi:hypothetical protein